MNEKKENLSSYSNQFSAQTLADTLNPNLKRNPHPPPGSGITICVIKKKKKPKDNSQKKQNFEEEPQTPEKPLHQAVTEEKEKVS